MASSSKHDLKVTLERMNIAGVEISALKMDGQVSSLLLCTSGVARCCLHGQLYCIIAWPRDAANASGGHFGYGHLSRISTPANGQQHDEANHRP